MNLPGYTVLETCPITPGCGRTGLHRHNDTGEVFQLNKANYTFEKHVCKSAKTGDKPTVVYLGEWFNKRTKKTRFIGPTRLPKSARLMPKDERSGNDDWELKGTYVAELNWKRYRG